MGMSMKISAPQRKGRKGPEGDCFKRAAKLTLTATDPASQEALAILSIALFEGGTLTATDTMGRTIVVDEHGKSIRYRPPAKKGADGE